MLDNAQFVLFILVGLVRLAVLNELEIFLNELEVLEVSHSSPQMRSIRD
jgi:hypothetical protein